MSVKKLSPEVQAIVSATDAGYYATTVGLVEAYVQANPTSQRGWLDLGHALVQLSRFDQARQALQRAIDLADGQPCDVIYGELGNLFRIQGNYDSAAEWFRKQIESDPSDATGYLFLGNLEVRRGNLDAGIEVLTGGLNCTQGCLEDVHYSLGLALRSAGQYAAAKRHLEQALKLDEQFTDARIALKDVIQANRTG